MISKIIKLHVLFYKKKLNKSSSIQIRWSRGIFSFGCSFTSFMMQTILGNARKLLPVLSVL
jgi:hypothetical protein